MNKQDDNVSSECHAIDCGRQCKKIDGVESPFCEEHMKDESILTGWLKLRFARAIREVAAHYDVMAIPPLNLWHSLVNLPTSNLEEIVVSTDFGRIYLRDNDNYLTEGQAAQWGAAARFILDVRNGSIQ